MKIEKINESSTSRMFSNLHGNFAIISPYRSENDNTTNKKLMTQLKSDVRTLGLGFNQLVSRWVEDGVAFDEESLFVANMSKEDALRLGKKYHQASVIVSENDNIYEIATNDFENYKAGQIVRTFNLSGDKPMNLNDAEKIFNKQIGGPVSMAKKGGKPFTLSEVYEIETRPSYFHNEAMRIGTIFRR